MKFDARIDAPSQLVPSEVDEFCNLVLACGEVQAHGLEDLVRAAAFLVRVWSDELLVGAGGLKNPRPMYKARVFEAAGVKASAAAFSFEVGWVAVHPDARRRGVGRLAMEGLLEASAGHALFATCRIDNAPMQGLLADTGFRQLGEAYKSTRGEHRLALWTKSS